MTLSEFTPKSSWFYWTVQALAVILTVAFWIFTVVMFFTSGLNATLGFGAP